MSFEPRLIGRSDSTADATDDFVLNLPPELTALGEQLGADSAFLAERYPAKQAATTDGRGLAHFAMPCEQNVPVPFSAQAGRRRGNGFRFGAAAAAILAGVFGWQVGSMQRPAVNSRTETPGSHSIATNPDLAIAPHAAVRPAANANELHGDQSVQEVAIDAASHSKHASADEVTMLRTQLNGFEKVIGILQTELAARKQAEAEDRKQIESLQAEIAQLKGETK